MTFVAKKNEAPKHQLVQKVADYFGLGNVVSFTKIPTGRDNVSYFVKTSEYTYAFRFLRNFNEVSFENELTTQQALRSKNILTNSMIMNLQGNYLYHDNGEIFATVSKKLPGKHPSRPVSIQEGYLIGQALARFHSALDPNLLLDSGFLFVGRERLNENLRTSASYPLRKEIQKLLESSKDILDASQPSGILHGDFHADNLLINGSTVAILDLQYVGKGQYIVDIGRSVADICSEQNKLSVEKVKKFIEGYNSKRHLTKEEFGHLGKSIIFGAGCVAAWAWQNNLPELADQFMQIGISAVRLEEKGALFLQ